MFHVVTILHVVLEMATKTLIIALFVFRVMQNRFLVIYFKYTGSFAK